MFGSRSLQLDERRQASRRSFEAWILTSRKVSSEESVWKSESSYWLLKSEDNGSGKMAPHVGCFRYAGEIWRLKYVLNLNIVVLAAAPFCIPPGAMAFSAPPPRDAPVREVLRHGPTGPGPQPSGVCQQDNARPFTVVAMQRALQSVDMLPRSSRSPGLSPIKHVWDIIG
ncbi:uncharacterized protein TNCV_1135621 [Trichonephila clavipes]|nr:uncharacterized protein TNCV_1135621 [Trichonephila clavipes]